MHKKNSLLKFFFPFFGKKMYIIARALQQFQMLRISLNKTSRNWERQPEKAILACFFGDKLRNLCPSEALNNQFGGFYA